jgi:hypothetical protein
VLDERFVNASQKEYNQFEFPALLLWVDTEVKKQNKNAGNRNHHLTDLGYLCLNAFIIV